MTLDRNARAIDLVVQTATVELLGSYDVVVAPMLSRPAPEPAEARILGLIEFNCGGRGQLALSVTIPVAQATSRSQGKLHQSDMDWVRELTSQLMGKIKQRLGRFGLRVQSGLPSATTRSSIGRQLVSGEQRHYAFRSLKGDVFVSLVGRFDPAAFDYAMAAAAQENETLILF